MQMPRADPETAAVTVAQLAHPQTAPVDVAHWYKDAVVYQLHIKAFFDSTNDGVGDFSGLLQKLD